MLNESVTQLVECWFVDPKAVGSSPITFEIWKFMGMVELVDTVVLGTIIF